MAYTGTHFRAAEWHLPYGITSLNASNLNPS